MKKSMLGLACVFVYLIAVMSCEIPQSITIKGKPGVYIPLGSPFAGLEQNKRLENLISPTEIKKMMGESQDGGVKTYVYEAPGSGPDDAQAYIVHYPIAEMKLDFAEYIGDALKTDDDTTLSYVIPDTVALINQNQFQNQFPNGCYFTDKGLPSNTPTTPLFTIDLASMSKLVKEVNGGPFGLELDYNANFENNIEMRIPALGINTYQTGTKINNKLRFVNTGKTKFEPRTDLNNGKLEIYVRITKPASGTIAPEMVFEWTIATINASGDNLKGDYPIKNSLEEFLGKGIEIKKAEGRLYVGGVGNSATMSSLTVNGDNLISPNSPLIERTRPIFEDPFKKQFPQHSLNNTDYIDLTGILNNNQGTSTLRYQITIPEMVINKNNIEEGEKVFVDMVILLPLEFKVTTSSRLSGYVKLDREDIFPQPGNGDLFGRTGHNDDDLFSQLESVKITLKDPENNIIDGISILVVTRSNNQLLNLKPDEQPVTFGKNDFAYPFSPQFEIVLKKDTNQNYATLKIRRQDPDTAKFDFFLTVEAQADIDHTITF